MGLPSQAPKELEMSWGICPTQKIATPQKIEKVKNHTILVEVNVQWFFCEIFLAVTRYIQNQHENIVSYPEVDRILYVQTDSHIFRHRIFRNVHYGPT